MLKNNDTNIQDDLISDTEMLSELMLRLRFSHKRNTDELAQKLISKFGRLSNIIHKPVSELCEDGMLTETEALKIKQIGALHKYVLLERCRLPISIKDKAAIKQLLKAVFFAENRELLYIFPVLRGKIVSACYMGSGDAGSIKLSSKDIILRLQNYPKCTALIMAHNHPDGVCRASEQDIISTGLIYEEAHNADIELLAHYIYAKGEISEIHIDDSFISYFFSG